MSFASDVAKWAKLTDTGIGDTVRAVCLGITKEVVERTPVGNPEKWQNPEAAPPGYVGGRLRGNWFATIGSPSGRVTNDKDASGEATKERASGSIKDAPGTWWWITNNVPYAIPVEYGHSQAQAPAGMVRITVENVKANFRKAVRDNEPKF